MSEVKRYLSTRALPDSGNWNLSCVPHTYVRASAYDALHAEAEALRVALLGIASVNPAERGIEWAKSYASDGLKGAGSELYARWLDTFNEAEALRAENAKLRTALAEQGERQEAVAWYTEDHLTDKSATTWSNDVAERWRAKGWPVGNLYTSPQPSPDVRALVEALEDIANDYADRFDMDSPSTNPGMKIVVENARAALAAHRQAQQGA